MGNLPSNGQHLHYRTIHKDVSNVSRYNLELNMKETFANFVFFNDCQCQKF